MYQLVREREQYAFSERHCRRLLSSNPACVQRMELQQKLEGHHGCVNTVSFDTEAGDILVSGSDDMQIMMWDWERGTTRLSFSSGHSNNVFQARMMPHTGGSKIVTCAADGQVRLCELPQGTGSGSVSKSLLGQHYSRAHKLALDPLCPAHCFYSCGEDGLVMHYDLRCGTGVPDAQARTRGGSSSSQGGSRNGARRKLLACRGYSKMRGVTREVVGINAIHVNPMCPFQFALGAADPWARVYDVRCTRDQSADTIGPPTLDQVRSRSSLMSDQPLALLCPHHLSQGASPGSLIGDPHITCVMYSKQGELLASYNDENIYLFGAQASRGALGSSSSRRLGGGNGSGEGANPPQQADDRQQQQQHSAKSSPSRRPRETAAGEGPAAAAAAAGGASAVAAAADGVRYVLEEGEDERPRWRRRQRLVTAGEAAAAAAASASAGDSAGREPTHEQQQQQQQQQPLLPSAEDGSGLAASQRPSTQPLIDAQLVADKPPPAPDPLSDLPDASATQQEGPQSLSSPPAAAATAAVAGAVAGSAAAAEGGGGLHLPQGLSGYAGVMGGRFYDADSTSRDGVVASYYGHRNSATVKGVAFFGEDDEYICSGSDCGHVFLWDKARGNVVWWEDADSEVVNCLEPHPRLPLVLATSGIEHDIKVWGPTAPGPQPPPAAALRRAMATNHRERQSARDAYSEPEHWLLQLLAAQRRRSAAARRRRAAADAVAGGGGAGTNGQPAAGGAGSSDPNTTTTAAVAAVLATGAEGEEEEEPLLLPPGGVRIVWGGGRRSGRQQRRQGGGAGESEGGEEDDEGALSSSDVDDDELMDEVDDGGSEEGQPCQIS